MSVNMNDRYLDELLDAIEPIIAPKPEPIVEEPQPEPVLNEESSLDDMLLEEMDMSENLSIMDLFNAGEDGNTDSLDSSYEVLDEGDSDIGDLLASLASEDGDSSGVMSEEDVSALLDVASSAAESSAINDNSDQDADVKELLKQFTDDEDLSDIQEILDKNDNMEAVDESILEIPEVGLFQLEENMENDTTEDTSNIKKGLFSFLKKKNKEEKKEEQDTEDTSEDGKRKKKEKKKKEKKKKKVKEEAVEVAEAAEQGEVLDISVENAEPMEILEESEELSIGLEEFVDVDGMSDIEQLLSGGAFDVQGEPEEVREESGDKKGKDTKKKEKKESLFAKVFAMLTEEDEDEIPEAKATGITDENKNILEELSKEDKKKAKKEKKEKKKGKNAKNQKEGEEDLEEDNKKVKKKKEKKKKEKKVKTRKVVEIDTDKKLSRKRVMSIFALCLSILAAIIILQKATLVTGNLKEAVWAYDNKDYTTCYQNLLGVERSEKEEAIFQKSAIIISVQRKLDSYQHFMMMGLEVEALNSLLEGVEVYREQQDAAREWDVTTQITEIYQVICDKLKVFGVSDEDVEEILGYDSNVTYTKRLDSIVNGTPFVVEEPIFEEDSHVEEAKPLEDVLPWEEDFLPEDTREVSMQSAFSNENVDTVEVPTVPESQGQTVVVGSSPVSVSETGTVMTGGQNVGSGNTNVSVELNNGNAVVSGF